MQVMEGKGNCTHEHTHARERAWQTHTYIHTHTDTDSHKHVDARRCVFLAPSCKQIQNVCVCMCVCVCHVTAAKDLAARDWAGTSDPYVQVLAYMVFAAHLANRHTVLVEWTTCTLTRGP